MSLLLSFLIGSSILSTLISNLYIGRANMKFKGIKNYEFIPLSMGIIYGLFNVINVLLMNSIQDIKLKYALSFIIGGLQGFLFSLFGRFYYDTLPIKLFGFTKDNVHMVHIHAFLFYGLIYTIVINSLNKHIKLI